MTFIQDNTNKKDEELEVIQYGIEVFFINLFKIAFLFIVAFLLKVAHYLLVLFICYGFIRVFAAGVHAPSTFLCTILSFVFFLGGTYIALYVPMNFAVRIGLFILAFLLLIKYAPADTEERPLISRRHREKLKMQSLLAASVLFLIMILIKNETYKNLITSGVMLESIFITPVIYFILGKGYRNYEKINEHGD